jgi:hypothetical protein
LPAGPSRTIEKAMTDKKKTSAAAKAAIAGAAIGSAALAAALLYANRRKQKNDDKLHGPIPSGEKPETD